MANAIITREEFVKEISEIKRALSVIKRRMNAGKRIYRIEIIDLKYRTRMLELKYSRLRA